MNHMHTRTSTILSIFWSTGIPMVFSGWYLNDVWNLEDVLQYLCVSGIVSLNSFDISTVFGII